MEHRPSQGARMSMGVRNSMAIRGSIGTRGSMSYRRSESLKSTEFQALSLMQDSEKIKDDHEGVPEPARDFPFSKGLTTAEAKALLLEHGRNELPDNSVPKWKIFVSLLIQPMPIMIWLAAIVEAAIENWPDMGIMLAIQFINAGLGFYETTKAGDAVAALKASLRPEATVNRDGRFIKIDASELVPGDLVLLAAGSAVPADCVVNHGEIEVDQAALTGESMPVNMFKGDSARMGSTVVRGEVEGTVEFTGANTFFGKTATLLGGEEEVSNLQRILMRITVILTAASILLCSIVFGYLMGSGEKVHDAISFTVVLIIASIPVAIEIVCTTTLALGSYQLSAKGAIVTRLAAIEDLAGMDILCSDKTGTLTLNKMVLQNENPIYSPGETQYSLLRFAAMAAKWKEPARDALDTLTLNAADLPSLDTIEQVDFVPFDPIVKRTEGTLRDKTTGKVFKTTKGAPHVLLKLCKDKAVAEAVERDVHALGLRGIRSLAVAKTDDRGEWHMLGLLTFLDPPRPDTKDTIDTAVRYGVEVKMITGDHLLIARETARQLGMGTNIQDPTNLPSLGDNGKIPENLGKNYGPMIKGANGFAQVFPEHKFLIVEALRQIGHRVGMTGDGVNDAPALKRGDVGVAVSGATDAARAAADIVLTREGLGTIVEGIVIAREIFQRMKSFITYRVAATEQLLVFLFIAVLALHPNTYMPDPLPSHWYNNEDWPKFFRMPVLLLMLITLLNDGTLIAIGYDNVKASPRPDVWNLKVVFAVATVLGGVACISSLIMVDAALDSWNKDGFFQSIGIAGLSYGQITTLVYLKVSLSDFLTLFSARTHEHFFWHSRPSPLLLGAAAISLIISTGVACGWPESKPDGIITMGLALRQPKALAVFVWIYCLIWWFAQDTAKVVVYAIMRKYNAFNINGHVGVELGDASMAVSPMAASASNAHTHH